MSNGKTDSNPRVLHRRELQLRPMLGQRLADRRQRHQRRLILQDLQAHPGQPAFHPGHQHLRPVFLRPPEQAQPGQCHCRKPLQRMEELRLLGT